jgi:hypothetical protein
VILRGCITHKFQAFPLPFGCHFWVRMKICFTTNSGDLKTVSFHIPMIWFIGAGLSRTSDSIGHPNRNLFSWFTSKEEWKGNVCCEMHLFKKKWFQHHNHEQIFKTFCVDLHHFSSIEFEFYSMHLNSSCMQCHSIFSFKWDLVSTESIHFFNQLITTSIA